MSQKKKVQEFLKHIALMQWPVLGERKAEKTEIMSIYAVLCALPTNPHSNGCSYIY